MIPTYSTTEPQSSPRSSYPQDWPSYNLAQQNEKERFLALLRDLCNTVPQPPHTNGRPRLPTTGLSAKPPLKGRDSRPPPCG